MGILAAPQMPRVQEALKLTDEQKSKFGAIQDEQREAMQGLFQGGGGDRQAAFQKMTELRTKGNEKAMAVLTSEQKATWKDLTGEPFEVRFEGGPGGGGPGGGGQRRNNNN
jgi:Spy/CpxP family protein refolding chaperone